MTVSGEVTRGEKMLNSGTDPESYITEYTLVYEENTPKVNELSRLLPGYPGKGHDLVPFSVIGGYLNPNQ